MQKRAGIAGLAIALLLSIAMPAWAGGQWQKWVDCTQNWWDTGKEVTAKTRGSGLVTSYTPNGVSSQRSPRDRDITVRVNDPVAQKGIAGGSTELNWEYGKGYCWW